jgi:hypothetical protein
VSNTDNMRLVAVLSVQLLHRLLIAGDRTSAAAPPVPMAVFDQLDRRPADGTLPRPRGAQPSPDRYEVRT